MSNSVKSVIAVIPARMGSSRFPGKPLASILGISMLEHVYNKTKLCSLVDEVYVATCDKEIEDTVESFGGKAVMTSTAHERASDRVAEACRSIQGDIVVMVQGDEPMITPDMVESAIAPFLDDESIVCVNLAKRIVTQEEYRDPNTIKVAIAGNGDALYFSREPIPTDKIITFDSIPIFKQVCVIPFRREFLLKYADLEPTPLEKSESVDMMRCLEHGFNVRMIETTVNSHAVDTPEDLAMVEHLMADDPFVSLYLSSTK